MAIYTNQADHRVDIPLLELHVDPGETFEVPDELAAQFDANPQFAKSRAKTADVTVEPAIAEAVTAAPAVEPAPDAPAEQPPAGDH